MHDVLEIIEKRFGKAEARKAATALGRYLPENLKGFTAVKAGAYYGLRVACPICDVSPPAYLKYQGRKWRWLAVHIKNHRK